MTETGTTDIKFDWIAPTRVLAEADPPHPGGIRGIWPDGFIAIIPSGPERLEDPYVRDELVVEFSELKRRFDDEP